MHKIHRHFFETTSIILGLFFLLSDIALANGPGVVLDGHAGPGQGKHIVLIAADDEYRSEELIPQLAKILAVHHGFQCTVLFAIDPQTGRVDPSASNIPGLEVLRSADLMILFARWRELPDEQMKYIDEYVNSGKPILGLRTSTHAFNYTKRKDSPYAKYSYRDKKFAGGFGRQILGETWIAHYGKHNVESTRALIARGMENHPIVRGVKDVWGPSDVYAITQLSGDCQPILMGQVLSGMNPADPPNPQKALVPIAWIKTYTGNQGRPARVFTTTMGHALDLKNEGFRCLLVNAVYWCLGMEAKIPAQAKVDRIGDYDPNPIGMKKFKMGLTPAEFTK